MKKLVQFITLTSALFFYHALFAQKKIFAGYYISLQGDTVRGSFPHYTQWSKNPSNVEFISADKSNQVQLTPENSRKFVVEGYDEYVSFTGQRLINPIDDYVLFNEKSSFVSDDTVIQIVAFLRVVTTTAGGDLYIFKDSKRINFFLQQQGQRIVELRYKKTFDANRIIEFPDYRQQLKDLFAEVIIQKKLAGSLERLPYTEDRLSSFFQSMFVTTRTVDRQKKASTEWIISAGMSLNIVDVKADQYFTLVPRSYKSSFSPVLSFGLLMPLDRNFHRFFFNPQVKLFRYKNSAAENDGAFINSTTYKSDLMLIAGIGGGANLINDESFRFFITAGCGMMVQVNGKEVRQSYRASDHTPYGGPRETKLNSLSYAIDFSAGIFINKKIMISATHMIPSPIGKFILYNPRVSNFQLKAGYRLNE